MLFAPGIGIGIVLLPGGGLSSLQALALATGFPFRVVPVLMSVSLFQDLAAERRQESAP